MDYAHSSIRSDRMDVFLCASCDFFLGCTSGLIYLSCVFGVPTAQTNAIPISTVLTFGARDIGISKLLRSDLTTRHVTFKEALSSDIANFRFAELYAAHGLHPIENTPEEIRDLALEMALRVEGNVDYSAKDEELQLRFKALMRPGHYTYGGYSRIGRDFLRKYASLLEDASDKI